MNIYKQIVINDNDYIGVFHGDTVRNYTPVNKVTVNNVSTIFNGIYGKLPKHLLSGHIHQFKVGVTQSNGLAITSGAMVGSNDYVLSSGFIVEEPYSIGSK